MEFRHWLPFAKRVEELWMPTVQSGRDGYSVSMEYSSDRDGYVLHVSRYSQPTGWWPLFEGCPECDGQIFPDRISATAHAMAHGHIRLAAPYQGSWFDTWRAYGDSWKVQRQVAKLREVRYWNAHVAF